MRICCGIARTCLINPSGRGVIAIQGLTPSFYWSLNVAAEHVAEKVLFAVIPNEVRNLSVLETQEKRDSSARSVPRNDNVLSFSASWIVKT